MLNQQNWEAILTVCRRWLCRQDSIAEEGEEEDGEEENGESGDSYNVHTQYNQRQWQGFCIGLFSPLGNVNWAGLCTHLLPLGPLLPSVISAPPLPSPTRSPSLPLTLLNH